MKKIVNWLSSLFSSDDNKVTDSYGAPGRGKSVHISVITAISLMVLWYLSTETFDLVRPLVFPSPVAVFNRFIDTALYGFGNSILTTHIGWSMYRVFTAFFLACITAIPIGILMGVNRYMRGIFDPPIEFYRPIPPLAYLPLVIIWFGIDETAKIIIIYLAIFAPMVLNTRAGVRSVAIEQIHAAYSMGANSRQVLTQIILKAAMPEILTGMRIGIGFGWTTLVAAELLAAEQGLGFMINSAANFLTTSVVVMGIIVIGVIAYSFDLLMRYIEKTVVPWKGKV
ncbi:MAG: ABC transporter permease subunit [Gammaproteobacteria bacterium]|nr:ABC transporter permease subunit [Gammaproteobacteria bacterium]